jgi:hypothetical protein
VQLRFGLGRGRRDEAAVASRKLSGPDDRTEHHRVRLPGSAGRTVGAPAEQPTVDQVSLQSDGSFTCAARRDLVGHAKRCEAHSTGSLYTEMLLVTSSTAA